MPQATDTQRIASLEERVQRLEQIASAPRLCEHCKHYRKRMFTGTDRILPKCLFYCRYIENGDHDAPRCPHWTFSLKLQLESMADAIDPATP